MTRVRKDFGGGRYNTSRKSTTANGPAWQASGFFTILAICCVHWSWFQLRVSEWFQRNGKSAQSWRLYIQGKIGSVRSPQYRQYALISDFLDLAKLSIREEAALATNWIKDGPEGFEASEPRVGHHDVPGVEQFTAKSGCRHPARHSQMRVLGLGETINPSLEFISTCKGFFLRIRQSFDVIFCRICISNAVCFFRVHSEAILPSLRPAVNPLLGCFSGKLLQDQLA